jgi:hypothetical protein
MSSISLNTINGTAKKTMAPTAYFGSGPANTTTQYTANTTGPILGFGSGSTSGDGTLLSAFNKANATFTAPYNGRFKFAGWMQWVNGGSNAYFGIFIRNSGVSTDFQIGTSYATITPFYYEFPLLTGQTAQITATSSAAWGTYGNSLTISADMYT